MHAKPGTIRHFLWIYTADLLALAMLFGIFTGLGMFLYGLH